ncbi:hypothetical protein BGX38DRAFT_923463 [Terfezia claveryi]|nr:hypothetical protein BGX38DRAFT_923463 [Terfezia claveryi]
MSTRSSSSSSPHSLPLLTSTRQPIHSHSHASVTKMPAPPRHPPHHLNIHYRAKHSE